jgi:hypothetical protein
VIFPQGRRSTERRHRQIKLLKQSDQAVQLCAMTRHSAFGRTGTFSEIIRLAVLRGLLSLRDSRGLAALAWHRPQPQAGPVPPDPVWPAACRRGAQHAATIPAPLALAPLRQVSARPVATGLSSVRRPRHEGRFGSRCAHVSGSQGRRRLPSENQETARRALVTDRPRSRGAALKILGQQAQRCSKTGRRPDAEGGRMARAELRWGDTTLRDWEGTLQ